MKKKSFIAILTVVLFAILFTLGACGPMTPKTEVTPPEFYEQDGIEVGTDYIKITELYIPYDGLIPQYRINDGEWQDSGEFYNLQPGTTYRVSVYTKENDEYLASDVTDIDITTLRAEQQKIPSASYERQNLTVTLTNVTDEMEVLWEEKSDWTDEKTHTFYFKGTYTVQVRYKENTSYFVGQPQSLEVYVNGFKSGNGTEQDPFLISTYEEFMLLEDYVDTTDAVYVKLINDIQFPDQAVSSGLFTGNIYNYQQSNLYVDGNNKTIFSPKLHIEIGNNDSNSGLISQAREIKNLRIDNIQITLTGDDKAVLQNYDHNIGLLCGVATYVENCSVTGSIDMTMQYWNILEKDNIGGLVGEIIVSSNTSETDLVGIHNCTVDVTMNYTPKANDFSDSNRKFEFNFGGIVGGIKSTLVTWNKAVPITQCSANLAVTVKDLDQLYVGGILGMHTKDNKFTVNISNCYTTGSVQYTDEELKTHAESGDQFAYAIGGIAGKMSGTVDSCWSSLNILYKDVTHNPPSGISAFCFGGGILGAEDRTPQMGTTKTITNCLYTGNIRLDNTTGSLGATTAFFSIVSNAYTDNCYHKNGSQIGTAMGSTATEEATILTATWQRDTLKLDETIWNIVEGSMPTLK